MAGRGMKLADFLQHPKCALPALVRVSKGYLGQGGQDSVAGGDTLSLFCRRTDQFALCRDSQFRPFVIPIHSPCRFREVTCSSGGAATLTSPHEPAKPMFALATRLPIKLVQEVDSTGTIAPADVFDVLSLRQEDVVVAITGADMADTVEEGRMLAFPVTLPIEVTPVREAAGYEYLWPEDEIRLRPVLRRVGSVISKEVDSSVQATFDRRLSRKRKKRSASSKSLNKPLIPIRDYETVVLTVTPDSYIPLTQPTQKPRRHTTSAQPKPQLRAAASGRAMSVAARPQQQAQRQKKQQQPADSRRPKIRDGYAVPFDRAEPARGAYLEPASKYAGPETPAYDLGDSKAGWSGEATPSGVAEYFGARRLSVLDVQHALELLNLSQYSKAFARENIDGPVLKELDDSVLAGELQVASKLHRIKLLNFAHALAS